MRESDSFENDPAPTPETGGTAADVVERARLEAARWEGDYYRLGGIGNKPMHELLADASLLSLLADLQDTAATPDATPDAQAHAYLALRERMTAIHAELGKGRRLNLMRDLGELARETGGD